MDFYVLLLRIVHIFGAVFWAGSVFALAGFVSPAAAQAGPEGGKVMQRLALGTQFIVVLSTAAGLTVLSGLLLYWRASGGLRGDWMTTGTGIMFTLGGLAGLVALFVGVSSGRTTRNLAQLGASLEGPPTAEQAAEFQALQSRAATLTTIAAILLVIALIGMATARYVFF